jgi:hypothetical protein
MAIRGASLRYLRFRKRLFGMLFSAQLPCASRMIQCSHSRNVETSIEYQDSVLVRRDQRAMRQNIGIERQ